MVELADSHAGLDARNSLLDVDVDDATHGREGEQ
jgi:hypothetical protein